jgi:uncharacterized phiE125 gp8 family phage protein
MRAELKTAAANPATTTADVKQYGFMNTTKHDTNIGALIEPCTVVVEDYIQRKLINQSWYIYLTENEMVNRLASYNCINLYGLNVSSITEVLKYEKDNTSSAIASSNYQLQGNASTTSSNLVFNDTYSLDTSNARSFDSYRIEVVAGYGATNADIPGPVKTALDMLIGYYVKFGDNVSKDSVNILPIKYQGMLKPYISPEIYF